MRHIYSLFLVLFLFPTVMSAYHGKVVDEDQNPLVGASIIAMAVDSTYISSVATDSIGCFEMPQDDNIRYFKITSYGKEPVFRNSDTEDLGIIMLRSSSQQLDEVVITASNKDELLDKTVYRFSRSQLEKYPNALQVLNEVPFVKVLYSGEMYYKGFNNFTILIDGVQASTEQLRNLSKEDIRNVEVYDMPPARYLTTDLTPVINVTTRSGLSGGSLTIYLNDDLRNIYRDANSLSAIYNYKNSRFTAGYDMGVSNTNRDKVVNDLNYDIDGEKYGKKREGKNGLNHRFSQNASFGFMNRKDNDYQFNADFTYSFSRNKVKTPQSVNYYFDDIAADALTRQYVKSNSYDLTLYFEKLWNNGNRLSFNASSTYTPSAFRSSYKETLKDGMSLINSNTDYRGRFYSVQTSAQYDIKLGFGILSIYAQNIYSSNDIRQVTGSETTWFDQATIRPTLTGKLWQKLTYQLTPGFSYNHSNQRLPDSDGDFIAFDFTPFVRLNWRVSSRVNLSATYSRYVTRPTLSQLNENIQWIDSHYFFSGNRNLKPFINNNVTLSCSWEAPFGSIYGSLFYLNSPGYATNYFRYADGGILETYSNVDRFQRLGASISPNVNLTRDGRLSLYLLLNLSKVWGDGDQYSWQGVNFQMMPALTYMINNRWALQLNYQYPGKVISGHLIRPRAQHLGINAIYNPIDNMQISLYIENPFMDFKESEYTAPGSIVHTDFTTYCGDWKNRISLSFYYNIDFGRRRSQDQRVLQYHEEDNGVLIK